jgi:hypothetical protein
VETQGFTGPISSTSSPRKLLVSVTTVPWRVRRLETIVHSLLAQTYPEFDIRVYIPGACLRTNERYPVPCSLLDLERLEPRLHIRRIAVDYGPATKLLGPYLEWQAGSNSAVVSFVTVDDDALLERHAIEELVDAGTRYPDEAVGFMGISGGEFVHAEDLARKGHPSRSVSVLGGYRGVLYPVRVLHDSLVADHAEVSERCSPFLADDELISWNLARRGVARRVVATRYPAPDFMFNVQLLNLPGPVTHGDDNNAGVSRSRQCLLELYEQRGWKIPV